MTPGSIRSSLRFGPARRSSTASGARQGRAARAWQLHVVRVLLATDLASVSVAVILAYYGRFVVADGSAGGLNYPGFALSLIVVWLALLWAYRCYEPWLLGVGTEEFRRVLVATFALFGTIAIISYGFKLSLARGFVALALPLGMILLIASRMLVRKWVQRRRHEGLLTHRVLIVGDPERCHVLEERLRSDPNAGFWPIGVSSLPPQPGDNSGRPSDDDQVAAILDRVSLVNADTIAITASPLVNPDLVKRLSWALEGAKVDLVVAPALTDVAGPRIAIRPVAGLPLMYVDQPTLSGWTRTIKRSVDLAGAALGLVILSPLLLAIAIAVRVSSPGPSVYKQERIGAGGVPFTIWKFRSMRQDSDLHLEQLLAESGKALAPLYKMNEDPRVTSVGRLLRRFSLDELPQLVNVLRGEMSLVGPRPQRREEVERYLDHEHRRLMIRPGMTGLWQVSGRSDITWDEAVRLDLYYVENWSLALDLTILMRTVLAVWRGEGAY